MKHKILIADDDPDIRGLMTATLTAAGHEVLQAGDGEKAIEIAKRERPVLAVLDVMMPKFSGFQVTAALRDDPETANMAILIVSARGAESDRITGFEEGADDYLVKPFSPRELQLRAGVLIARQSGTAATRPAPMGAPGGVGASQTAGFPPPAPYDNPSSTPGPASPTVDGGYTFAAALAANSAATGPSTGESQAAMHGSPGGNEGDELPPGVVPLPQTSIGHPVIDRALGGGLPVGSNILLYGAIGSGKSTLCRGFISQGLMNKERAMFIALDDAPQLIRRTLEAVTRDTTEAFEERNLFRLVDAYSWSAGGAHSGERYAVTGILELNQLSGVVQDAGVDLGQTVRNRLGGRRVLDSISSLLVNFELPSVQRFLAQVARNAVAFGGVSTLFVLEEGTVNDQTLANIKYLMDGVIETRVDGGRHYARIASMKWTQHAREWVQI
jgi:CheY-like chemotaxis protein/KaiC/GvpD/RAD55 family RecA-like ATPase